MVDTPPEMAEVEVVEVEVGICSNSGEWVEEWVGVEGGICPMDTEGEEDHYIGGQ